MTIRIIVWNLTLNRIEDIYEHKLTPHSQWLYNTLAELSKRTRIKTQIEFVA